MDGLLNIVEYAAILEEEGGKNDFLRKVPSY